MIDTWLLVLIVIVVIAVSIEGIPDGFNKKAKTLVTELTAIAGGVIGRLASMIMVVAKRIGQRIRQVPSIRAPSLRVVIGTAVAVVSSPFAAIPITFVFALLLYALNMIGGDEYDLVSNAAGTLRYILGYTFIIWVATLGVISQWYALAFPFLIGLGFIAASFASRSIRFVRKLALLTLVIGGVYPLIFMLAAALDVFNEPIFN